MGFSVVKTSSTYIRSVTSYTTVRSYAVPSGNNGFFRKDVNDFDLQNGVYTVPKEGYYYFAATVHLSSLGSYTRWSILLSIDNSANENDGTYSSNDVVRSALLIGGNKGA